MNQSLCDVAALKAEAERTDRPNHGMFTLPTWAFLALVHDISRHDNAQDGFGGLLDHGPCAICDYLGDE